MNELKINSENYESFYLDYLEGNLEENDVLELFAFLNEHPEFKVEDDLLILDKKDVSLDLDFKNLLKVDLSGEHISLNTIDFFLLAQKEGQLTAAKQKELDDFLNAHPSYKLDQKLYSLTELKADTSIVYADKKKLKQRAPIVLWPYMSAAAAASVVFVFWMLTPKTGSFDAQSAARGSEYKEQHYTKGVEDNHSVPTFEKVADTEGHEVNGKSLDKNSIQKEKKTKTLLETNPLSPQLSKNENDEKPAKIKAIEFPKLDKVIIAQTPQPETDNDSRTITAMNNTSYGMSMNDVARPVTRKISEIANTDVKLKKGKDAKGEREGFYFKLGTFEFYRNKKVKP